MEVTRALWCFLLVAVLVASLASADEAAPRRRRLRPRKRVSQTQVVALDQDASTEGTPAEPPAAASASPVSRSSRTRSSASASEPQVVAKPRRVAKPSRRRGTATFSEPSAAAKPIRIARPSRRRGTASAKSAAAVSQAPVTAQQEGIASAVAAAAPKPASKVVIRPTSGAPSGQRRRRRKKGRSGASSTAQVAVRKGPQVAAVTFSAPKPVPSEPVGKAGRKIVCYYTNWSQYRPSVGKYMPENIDPFLCTHIVFAFSSMKNNRLSPFEHNDISKDGKVGLYEQVTNLKKINPKLKVLLAIGGWSFGTKKFKDMSSNRYNRRTFVYSVAPYLRERNFDGLDLDWEYPKGSSDKTNFAELCRELREAFEEEARDTGAERLLLTAAVPVGPDSVRGGYDVAKLARHLDLFHIMAYDFHGKWESQVGHNAPLNAPSSDSTYRRQLSVNASINMWMSMGAPKHKIVVGMPTYGRSFTLANPGNNKVNAPARGGGSAGRYTKEEGFLAYYEICEKLHGGANYIWDDEMSVPYMIDGNQWVGFDDERAIRLKMNFIQDMDLAGAMVWSVDMDDFAAAACGGAVYPLMTAMREELLEVPRSDNKADIDWSKVAKRQLPAADATSPLISQLSIADIIAILKAQGITPGLDSVQKLLTKVSGSRGTVKTATPTTAVAEVIDDNLAPPKVFCYVTSWARDREGRGRFSPADLDPKLCTHVVWAFGGIQQGRIELPSQDQDRRDDDSDYQQLLRLRDANPNLKLLLGLGGYAVDPATFQDLTASSYRMNTFVYDAVDAIRKVKLDGVDIHWEYPSGHQDRRAYSSLLQEFRLAFDSEASATRKPRLLLTAALPANPDAIQAGYDIPEISKYLDFLNLMAFDFHGAWDDVVGHNAPLYPMESASRAEKKLSVDGAARELVREGAPPEKILIGLATYGRTYTLQDPALYDIGAPVVDAGKQGRFTQEPGFVSHFEVCDFLDSENTTLVWDHEQEVPFAFRGDQWVGFDDERSLMLKVDWLRELGFGGVMLWAADLDDFSGACGNGRYPLIAAVQEALDGYRVPYTYDGASGAAAAAGTSGAAADPNEVVCDNDVGEVTFHRDALDCKHYYLCQGIVRHHMPCPSDLVFNEAESVCDWPENVEACWAFTTAPPAI
ncbi:probable chitinase 10 [Pollicipes pollicipes]|uniref:probable chitinase 10 n=1 Tax=Pollicipes pollicipes TaxID=41117 RepID=UPI001884DB59|nr:probable chitinase 10 [Pollicipes pollicipes]